jgi:hypothetical protein
MATKGRKTGSKKGGQKSNVSLADEDRRYINESLSKARGRVAGADLDEGGVLEALERFGLSSERVQRLREAIGDVDVRESIDKASDYLAEQIENARDYTRQNPKKVMGSAAGVLVGASLLALAIRRAAGEEKRRTSSTPSASKKSASKKSASKKSSSKKRSSKNR